MTASYYIVHRDAYGNNKGVISPPDWFKLEYIRKENDYGSLYLDLVPDFPFDYFQVDDRLEVFRSVEGGSFYRDMEAVWFVRLVRHKTDESQHSYLHVLAHDAVSLLDRRIVAYQSGTAHTNKTAHADDMIKQIARENYGVLCEDTTRNISEYFKIDDDFGLAYTTTREFARRKILPLMQEISDDSANSGDYLAFDVVYDSPSSVRLKTYVGARGQLKNDNLNRIILSMESGVLGYASIAYDRTEEKNFIYAGGRGEKDDRVIATAKNDSRIGASPFNRCEDWLDARDEDSVDAVQASANARLEEAKPKTIANGHIQQLPGALYGVDYFFGDVLPFQYQNHVIDVHLDTVRITVDSSGENVVIYSRNLDEAEY